jgi:alpha,alpha-trehalase
MDKVLEYIHNNWERTIYQDKDGSGFRGIDLPHSYTSPCIKGEGKFCFFFYWDTYFTNIGLLKSGREEIAKNNILNMLWLIQRQGYMPNHVGIYNRSQPAYLCRMVKEYLEATGDDAFVSECAEGLRQEYAFWMTARFAPNGLNRYGSQETDENCVDFHDRMLHRRLGVSTDIPEEEKARVGRHYLAEAETGWDFNQRFDGRCDEHNATCINALLYELEVWLSEHADQVGWDDADLLKERAEKRIERTNRYLWKEEKGWYFDYDFVNGKQSDVMALTGMQPLMAGMASQEQAEKMRNNLHLLEGEHGIAVTDERPECRNYQWAFPNVWPPLSYVAVEGLRRYGLHEDARRIASKYVETTRRLFDKTEQIWEKTDAETGEVAGGEYDAAPMLGWTAGVYIDFLQYLEN